MNKYNILEFVKKQHSNKIKRHVNLLYNLLKGESLANIEHAQSLINKMIMHGYLDDEYRTIKQ